MKHVLVVSHVPCVLGPRCLGPRGLGPRCPMCPRSQVSHLSQVPGPMCPRSLQRALAHKILGNLSTLDVRYLVRNQCLLLWNPAMHVMFNSYHNLSMMCSAKG